MKKAFLISIIFLLASLNEAIAQKINWLSIEKAIELNKTNEKKFLIDVYTDWCGYCKKMDRNTYENKILIKYINENFHPVKLDAEQKENIIFKGKTFKFINKGRRGYHEFAAFILNGKMSYPSTVFLDTNENYLDKIPGYLEPKLMEKIVSFFGEDKYKNTEWSAFEQNFKSTL